MPTVIATIQNRKGSKEDFDPARMKPGEIAVTTDGTNEAYVCVGNGQCKEFLKQVKKVNGVSPNDSGELTINKNNVELGNVDNTSDEDKPISEAQQMALDGKVSKTGDVMTGSLTLQRSNGNTAFRLKNSADASEHLDIYINGAGVPLVTHVKNGVSSNTMALYGDRTWFGQPVSITSGGTEATTTAEGPASAQNPV